MLDKRIPLTPGYHAEPGATKGHQHDVYTTLGELHGYKRIHVGTLMKEAVDAWAETAKHVRELEQTNASLQNALVGSITG